MKRKEVASVGIPVLRRQLRDVNPSHRHDALQTIARFNARELLEDVVHCFELESEAIVKAKCAWVLGHFHYKPAFELLKACSKDKAQNEDVRVWAAWAVGELATTDDEALLRHMLARAESAELRRAIGGALKKVSLHSVRAPASQIARQLRPPPSSNPRIRGIVDRMLSLEADMPYNLSLVVELRRKLKATDEGYFCSYMEWLKRKPALERALENPRAVYQD